MKSNSSSWFPSPSKFLLLVVLSGNLVFAQNRVIPLRPQPPGMKNGSDIDSYDGKGQVTHVALPRLVEYLPEHRDTLMPAVIVCPGGAYRVLAIEKEGSRIARWLNSNGIAAYVLFYTLDPPEALEDVRRAVRVLRAGSPADGIDPAKIGVIGFSAGAHLSANLAVHFNDGAIHDAVDSVSARPDYWIGLYGAYEPFDEGADSVQFVPLSSSVTASTPPAFIVHAADDPRAPVFQSLHLYEALQKNRVPAELHVYQNGGHGFALEENRGDAVTSTVRSWSERCIRWLELRGVIHGRK